MDICRKHATEVRLRATSPTAGLERLHHHLPSSVYSYGALYTSLSDHRLSYSPSARPAKSGPALKTQSDLLPGSLLLLEADCKWRLGGLQEEEASPPLLWTSEDLCGPPPYQCRDLKRFKVVDSKTVMLRCPAAFMIRLDFHDRNPRGSGYTAIEFLKTNSIHKVPGWLKDEWYDTRTHDPEGGSASTSYVCILSFDAQARIHHAESLVKECLETMRIHVPLLGWNYGSFRLEGSLSFERKEMSESDRFWSVASAASSGEKKPLSKPASKTSLSLLLNPALKQMMKPTLKPALKPASNQKLKASRLANQSAYDDPGV